MQTDKKYTEAILEPQAKKITLNLLLIEIVIWPIWIIFDVLFSPENLVVFMTIRLFFCAFAIAVYTLLRRDKIKLVFAQYLFLIPPLITVAFMFNVVAEDVLFIYFLGATLVLIVGYSFLPFPLKRGIWFFLIAIVPIFLFNLIFPNHSIRTLVENGGILYFSVALFGIALAYGRYRYAMSNEQKSLIIEEQKNELEKNYQQLTTAFDERNLYLNEMQHRVKNNLQMIYSLVSLQESYQSVKSTTEILESIQNKVLAIATIHELLFKSDYASALAFSDYVAILGDHYRQFFKLSERKITIETEIDPIELPISQVLPCGLIINELITNSIKHAFSEDEAGRIKLSVKKIQGEEILLRITDNGCGIPEDKLANKDGSLLGLVLINGLCDQLNGEMKCESTKETGTSYSIQFKLKKDEKIGAYY